MRFGVLIFSHKKAFRQLWPEACLNHNCFRGGRAPPSLSKKPARKGEMTGDDGTGERGKAFYASSEFLLCGDTQRDRESSLILIFFFLLFMTEKKENLMF
jgi:hypothetical protein